MRNSGWYIPFWRKPKRAPGEQGQPERQEKRRRPRQRSDEDLERVRDEWVGRYTRRVQAFRVLGLSVGTPADEVDARYQRLASEASGAPDAEARLRDLREAYETLKRE